MRVYQPHHAHLAPGSLGDSVLKISEYVKRAKHYGLKYLTMTDHGSLSAMYTFYAECRKNDIIPIIGIEMYEAANRLEKNNKSKEYNHLILIAKNLEGLSNLFELQNDASMTGFYYKPRTDLSVLKKYGKGIIGLSACVAGSIPEAILNDDPEKAVELIEAYKDCFDEFYLEIQPGNFPEQIKVNDALVELAAYTNTPLVATNDIHYLNQEDYIAHDAHVRISRKMTIDQETDPETGEKKERTLIYPDKCYWFMDRDDMHRAFTYTKYITPVVVEEALNNTLAIAEQCNLVLSTDIHMPEFIVEEGETEEEALNRLCFQKLDELLPNVPNPSEYVERLLYELDVINQLGFCGYFLMVYDFVNHAREVGISVGPGRGSVGGALTAHILGISLADPIKYGLMFERFLSPHRKSIPDIDIDYDSSRRDEMFRYAVSEYGINNCALVSTLHMRKAKGALRDSARVLGIDYEIGDAAAKLIPVVYYDDDGEKTTDLGILDSISIIEELRVMQEKYPELFDLAIKLEGLASGSGIHAAGIIISPISLTDKLPLVASNKEGILATSLNLADAETAGFVKFDYLSLASLAVIDNTERAVNFKFDFRNDEMLSDPDVWSLIGSRNTTGLFQISSKTYKDRMPRLKPTTIQELAACLALVRGPCISSGADKQYMEIIEGKRVVDPIHPLYYKATKNTNGILIYQEDLMQIIVNFGFDLETGYKVVKFVAKKQIDKIKEFEVKFMAKAADKKVPKDIAARIWQIIVDAGQYAFNISHATSYALLCYASAYLKHYYPKEYLTNLLTNAYDRGMKEIYVEILDDCRRYGIKFLPIDVNKSMWEFKLDDGSIRIGMCAVKSFGEKAFSEVNSKRPFVSIEDFLEKIEGKKCNKKVVNVAIFAGMFDEYWGGSRLELYHHYMNLRDEDPVEDISTGGKEKFSVFSELADLESSLLGGQFLSDPSNDLKSFGWEDIKISSLFEVNAYIKAIKKHKDSKQNQMAFLTLSTGDGTIDCTVFSSSYEKFKKLLKKNSMCLIKAKKDGSSSCILQAVG